MFIHYQIPCMNFDETRLFTDFHTWLSYRLCTSIVRTADDFFYDLQFGNCVRVFDVGKFANYTKHTHAVASIMYCNICEKTTTFIMWKQGCEPLLGPFCRTQT